jgi:hypothetical protein
MCLTRYKKRTGSIGLRRTLQSTIHEAKSVLDNIGTDGETNASEERRNLRSEHHRRPLFRRGDTGAVLMAS